MTIERRNPLPPGRYWVDILTPQLSTFDSMLRREEGNVVVEHREEHPNLSNFNASTTTFIFRNARPLPWKQGWSLPSHAPTDVQTAADTSQRPAPDERSGLDILSDLLSDTRTAAIVLFALWMMTQGSNRK